MKIVTNTGSLDFNPAFTIKVEKKQRVNGDTYFDILDDNINVVKWVAVNVFDGHWWFYYSQLEEVRNRLAAKGLGLQIVDG